MSQISRTIEAIQRLPDNLPLFRSADGFGYLYPVSSNDLIGLAEAYARLLTASKVLALSMSPTFAAAQTAPARHQTLVSIQNDFLVAIEEAEK